MGGLKIRGAGPPGPSPGSATGLGPCKGIQDNLGFLDSTPWIRDLRLFVSGACMWIQLFSVNFLFELYSGFQDSGLQKKKFPGFRIPKAKIPRIPQSGPGPLEEKISPPILVCKHNSSRANATSTFAIMHLICPPRFCITFLFLGITSVLREIENNACAKFLGANKVHYGTRGSGLLTLYVLGYSF